LGDVGWLIAVELRGGQAEVVGDGEDLGDGMVPGVRRGSTPAGDYLYTPPGRSYAARAVTDTRFVLVLPSIPDYG
jgi:hypothetical protein